MEVSGKVPEMETRTHFCHPCNTERKATKADGFCTGCEEFMCSTCFQHHLKSRLSRHHVLGSLIQNSSEIRNIPLHKGEICAKHQNEIVKYYCSHHDAVCCGDCVVSEHSSMGCKPVFIRDIAKSCEDSREFQEICKMVQFLEQKRTNSEKWIESNREKNKLMNNEAVNEMRQLRKKLFDGLEKAENCLVTEVQQMTSDNESLLTQLEQELLGARNIINEINDSLDTKLYQNEGLFIHMINSKKKVSSVKQTISEIESNEEFKIYEFEPEKSFTDIMSSELRLGRITVFQRKMDQESLGTPIEDQQIRVRALYDYTACTEKEMSFKEEDIFILVEKTNQDWWYVRKTDNEEQEGYVPKTYVTVVGDIEDSYLCPVQSAKKIVEINVSANGTTADVPLNKDNETPTCMFLID